MNVTTIAMDRATARKAFQDYQAAVRADRADVRKVWKAEDLGLMQAYKHLARGTVVLDLHGVMKEAGTKLFPDCPVELPVLAIAPSDAPTCFLRMTDDGSARFSTETWPRSRRRTTILPAGTFPKVKPEALYRLRDQSTTVPIIPPALRPKFNLANYRTLWEVEAWTAEPPKDPMLLKPLGGALYAVLATWDLTDIERAILRRRA